MVAPITARATTFRRAEHFSFRRVTQQPRSRIGSSCAAEQKRIPFHLHANNRVLCGGRGAFSGGSGGGVSGGGDGGSTRSISFGAICGSSSGGGRIRGGSGLCSTRSGGGGGSRMCSNGGGVVDGVLVRIASRARGGAVDVAAVVRHVGALAHAVARPLRGRRGGGRERRRAAVPRRLAAARLAPPRRRRAERRGGVLVHARNRGTCAHAAERRPRRGSAPRTASASSPRCAAS